jgi:hypothetical protein
MLFGAAFGFLISWGQFSDPDQIRAMLLFEDPYLWQMMALAMGLGYVGLHLLERRRFKTLIDRTPIKLERTPPERRHFAGAALFGVGWAITDSCPGPIASQLAQGVGWSLFTLAGLLLGVLLYFRTQEGRWLRAPKTMLLLLAVGASALGTATGIGAVDGAAAAASPQSIEATARGVTVNASQGSYCGPSGTGPDAPVLCADFAYPLPVRCKLPVKPGGTVTITTARDAVSVSASLVRPNPVAGQKPLKRLRGGAGRTWRFKLPKRVREYAAVSVSAAFSDGDSNAWAGLASKGCRAAEFSRP